MPLYELDGKRPTFEDENDCWIAPNATLIGDVRIGKGASIWWGVTIRADNEPITIGEGAQVQDGSVLHADPGFPLYRPEPAMDELADMLASAVGHIGTMAEYLLNTVTELERAGVHDLHLWQLQEMVAERLERLPDPVCAALDAVHDVHAAG